jgi:hypothetical protein
MTEAGLIDEVVRGVIGLGVFAGLFLAARRRFAPDERRDGPTDIGLD